MEKSIIGKGLKRRLEENVQKTIVELYINDECELYNHFSILNNHNIIHNDLAKINHEIIEYLETETANIPINNSLVINIKTSKSFDIKHFEKLIRRKVSEKITIINQELKKIGKTSILLTLIGLFLIGTTQIFTIFINRYALRELVTIASWVFIWKSVELFFFERIDLVQKKIKLAKIFYSKIKIENITVHENTLNREGENTCR